MPTSSPSARMRDADAVAKARMGEPDGLAQIYEAHAKALYRLIYRLAASPADAEDILHDLCVALPELLRRYDDRGKLGAWLRQVATRMTLMRLRAQRRRGEVPIEKAGAIAQRAVPNDAFLVERAILELPEQQRQVFVLRQRITVSLSVPVMRQQREFVGPRELAERRDGGIRIVAV